MPERSNGAVSKTVVWSILTEGSNPSLSAIVYNRCVMKIKKISVLLGGWSDEREISIKSGKNVANVLRNMGYDVSEIDVKKDLQYITEELYKSQPDFIFNILHGTGGEDGVIQGVLDIFGVPYSGCNLLSSAICFDKAICKDIVKNNGIRIIDGFVTDKKNISCIRDKISYPFVIKPAACGSSVGVFLILDDDDWNKFIKTEWVFDNKIIVEKYIKGREFTVCVINGKAIGALEILYKNKSYDFESKYDKDGSKHITNFNMDETSRKELIDMSEKAFKACYCSGCVRIDYRYDGSNIYFLEINTQPGMTSTSLVPDIALNANIAIEDLLMNMITNHIGYK